jgi:hypothetical protein
MSIKIYGGLLLNYDIEDIFEAGLAIRKVLNPLFYAHANAVYETLKQEPKEKWHSALDIPKTIQIKERGSEDYEYATYDVIKGCNEHKTHIWSDHADCGYHVVLMPNAHNPSRILANVYGGKQGEYTEALIESGIAVEYHYQDQTDQPDDITDEAWDARRVAWGYLIDTDHTPSSCGLTIEYPSFFDFFSYLMHKDDNDN